MTADQPKYNIHEIACKWVQGNITAEEEAYFEEWYAAFDDREVLLESDRYSDEESLKFQILNALQLRKKQQEKKSVFKLWPRLTVAASVAIVLGLGLFFYKTALQSILKGNAKMAIESNIGPGKNTAVLTLANGRAIELSDSQEGVVIDASSLKYIDGSLVSGSSGFPKDEQDISVHPLRKNNQLAIRTPRGGTYQVILPDGSKVWLNAASILKFPAMFSATHRTIDLVGEAYFEVSKIDMPGNPGKRMPFLVSSKGQQVEVLGTHFNISSYDDERATKTTLLEGSVRVNEAILKPGQQSVLMANEAIKVVPANIEAAMDWKNGDFIFKGEDFKTTMRKIARWYDVDIVYDNDMEEDIELLGWISRKSKLSEVLDRIELAGHVHFKVEGRRVFVTK